MLDSSDSFVAVEYCDDIAKNKCDEIAIVVFGKHSSAQPRLHKLVGWMKIAAHLPAEELEFVSKILNEIVNRIRHSRESLFDLQQFENVIRVRGPFSADLFDANYKSRILG